MLCCPLLGCAPGNEVASGRQVETPSSVIVWDDMIDINGRNLELFSAGFSPAAIIFILPDCPICNSYIPEFNRLHEQFASRGVPIILVHADPATTSDQARDHAREYNIACPVVIDPDRTWLNRFEPATAPEAVVFSPKSPLLYRGRIDDQYAGLGKRRMVVTSHDLRDALEAILAGKPVREPRTEAVGCPIPK